MIRVISTSLRTNWINWNELNSFWFDWNDGMGSTSRCLAMATLHSSTTWTFTSATARPASLRYWPLPRAPAATNRPCRPSSSTATTSSSPGPLPPRYQPSHTTYILYATYNYYMIPTMLPPTTIWYLLCYLPLLSDTLYTTRYLKVRYATYNYQLISYIRYDTSNVLYHLILPKYSHKNMIPTMLPPTENYIQVQFK